MSPFVILDRDGVLNVDLPGSLVRLEDLTVIPEATKGMGLLRKKGYRVLVATNQACVGRGLLAPTTLKAIHREIEKQVSAEGGAIDAWFVCTHREEDGCACRKPRAGLLFQAQALFGFALAEVPFVGDAGRDVEAAIAAGCRPILLGTGKGEATRAQWPNVEFHENLLAFAESLQPLA